MERRRPGGFHEKARLVKGRRRGGASFVFSIPKLVLTLLPFALLLSSSLLGAC